MFLCVSEFMTIAGRGNAFGFFENLCKDTIVTVAGFHGNIRDGKICRDEQLSGMIQTDIGEIRQEINTDFTAEQL